MPKSATDLNDVDTVHDHLGDSKDQHTSSIPV